jgi:hypothetical protein
MHERDRRVLPERLEQTLRGEDVRFDVARELRAPALPHAGLRGEMKHAAGPVEEPRDVARREILLDEREPAPARAGRQMEPLPLRAVVIGERVHGEDLEPLVEQPFAEMGADESGRSRYHRFSLHFFAFSPAGVPPGCMPNSLLRSPSAPERTPCISLSSGWRSSQSRM